jgi:hypothetical protein
MAKAAAATVGVTAATVTATRPAMPALRAAPAVAASA